MSDLVVAPAVAGMKPAPSELLAAARHIGQNGIQSEAQAQGCLQLLGLIEQLGETVTTAFEPSVKAAHEAHKAILAARDAHTDVLEEAERLVRAALNRWVATQADAGEPVAGLQVVNKCKFVVENLAMVPREYLMLDEKKVKAVIKADGEQTQIPGIRVFTETSARRRQGAA